MNTWLLDASSCQSALTAWAVVIPFLPYCEVHAAAQSAAASQRAIADAFSDAHHQLHATRLQDAEPLPSVVDFDARCHARRL